MGKYIPMEKSALSGTNPVKILPEEKSVQLERTDRGGSTHLK
jgi:hypothetical protein